MSRTPRRPSALAGTIFLGAQALADGLLTAADLRSGAWQQVLHGIYADAAMTITHRHRCLAVARYVLPPGGAVAGRSAAYLYGVPFVGAYEPVEVLVPYGSDVRPAGTRVHHASFDRRDLCVLDGLPVTTPARSCWDLAQRARDPTEAIVMIDTLAARHLVALPELDAYVRDRAGQRGWRRLLDAALLADAGAGSPQESRLRVRLVKAGLPRPQTQFVIVSDGRFVARSDLAWPEYRVAVEYDGVWHAESPAQIHADRRRLNNMVTAGWVVLHVTSKRLRDDFDGFVRELRAVLRSRGAR